MQNDRNDTSTPIGRYSRTPAYPRTPARERPLGVETSCLSFFFIFKALAKANRRRGHESMASRSRKRARLTGRVDSATLRTVGEAAGNPDPRSETVTATSPASTKTTRNRARNRVAHP